MHSLSNGTRFRAKQIEISMTFEQSRLKKIKISKTPTNHQSQTAVSRLGSSGFHPPEELNGKTRCWGYYFSGV